MYVFLRGDGGVGGLIGNMIGFIGFDSDSIGFHGCWRFDRR
jgi:hypothetical protein